MNGKKPYSWEYWDIVLSHWGTQIVTVVFWYLFYSSESRQNFRCLLMRK